MDDVEPSAPASKMLDAPTLLRAIKSRRSVRDFRAGAVEREKINLVLQAGRYTATAKNAQGCRFVVVQKGLSALKSLVWSGVDDLLALPAADKPRWVKLYKPFSRDRSARDPQDFLFRNAPAVVFIACERADDAGLAAQNMELMAASLGLGMLFNGYLCRAVEGLSEAKAWLDCEGVPVQMCMLLGYPAVSYPRTAPRLPGDFVVK